MGKTGDSSNPILYDNLRTKISKATCIVTNLPTPVPKVNGNTKPKTLSVDKQAVKQTPKISTPIKKTKRPRQ